MTMKKVHWRLSECPFSLDHYMEEGIDLHVRILSPRERTLTVEALEYLDAHRPGTVASALPPSPTTVSRPTPLWDVSVHWSLSDVIDCIRREAHRCEAQYPILMPQGLLSAKQAQQELGQMKAALSLLTSMRERGQDARQGALSETTEDQPRFGAIGPSRPPLPAQRFGNRQAGHRSKRPHRIADRDQTKCLYVIG